MASPPAHATIRPVREVVDRLRQGGPILVALSGGVDSSVVAALAREALGAEAWAVTLTSPSTAAHEVARAESVARLLGLRHQKLAVNQLQDSGYRANGPQRCYFCRHIESRALLEYGRTHGVRQYADGIHRDDVGDDRPGMRAMDEAGFIHPLLWGGWGKTEIRAEARLRGLPNWDEPSDACLASRVRHGNPIDGELLRRIEEAEARVRSRGYRRVRVRTWDGRARVEVDSGEVERLLQPDEAIEVVRLVRSSGFAEVELDTRGYRPRPGM